MAVGGWGGDTRGVDGERARPAYIGPCRPGEGLLFSLFLFGGVSPMLFLGRACTTALLGPYPPHRFPFLIHGNGDSTGCDGGDSCFFNWWMTEFKNGRRDGQAAPPLSTDERR